MEIRYALSIGFIVLIIVISPINMTAKDQSVQKQIDDAKPGDTIILSDGEYHESIIINKPLHIISKNQVTFINDRQTPTISITENGVTLEQISIKHFDQTKESPAILVQSDDNVFHNIQIKTNSYGIQLNDANHNMLSEMTIAGDESLNVNERKHGIDLINSHYNTIKDSTITDVQDGIYVEKSNDVQIDHNTISQSRYGIHLMFTNQTNLEHNLSFENISGMMIMGTNDVIATHNTLKNNQKNVQALGLLLFDARNSIIKNNDIINNRIGIFIENANDNDISFNHVYGNYIALQLFQATENIMTQNAFVTNVIQAQAIESAENDLNRNFWGNHGGIDLLGNGESVLKHQIDPFFLNITDEYPPFQLLFDSPGMAFLEQLIQLPSEQTLVDKAPLIDNPLKNDKPEKSSQVTLFVSLTIFLMSLITIYFGGKT